MTKLKIFIAEICISILRKLEVSVFLGMSVKGGSIQPLTYDAYWYDSIISEETNILDCEGFDLKLPINERFSYSYPSRIKTEERAS